MVFLYLNPQSKSHLCCPAGEMPSRFEAPKAGIFFNPEYNHRATGRFHIFLYFVVQRCMPFQNWVLLV
jgi:hypothetical protein